MRPAFPAVTSLNPFLVWFRLWFQTAEMLAASAQVIGHRTTRMMSAGPLPSARDQREFTKMGQEKVDAVMESAMAASTRYLLANQQLVAGFWQQAMTGMTSMMTAAASPARMMQLPGQAYRHAGALSNQMIGAMAHVGQHGLKPIHRRATGNARRLIKLNPVGGAPLGKKRGK
ncbi:polyhydroxyalkanoate granule-associated phasin [Noviherbaspirillum galbum]|uniref:Phasin domain-containing protein n=1 Tax=Noviherbaspirillum galbum TaxID=2709383 RepID=A0A6B3SL70_9BURK|nr:polyhydroxyalkanoate granule-associated phasin [Noviherbaspirillum galbum]NEX61584.1 hypothetical protein [Noviherbaspirillum galbum]